MEMQKLAILLANADIPFDYNVHRFRNRLEICYPVGPALNEKCVCTIGYYAGSIGYGENLLQIVGKLINAEDWKIEGNLTAEEVFERIYNHYYAGD